MLLVGKLASKKAIIALVIVIAIIAIAGLAYYFILAKPFSAVPAKLSLSQGNVQVLRNNSWQNAVEGMQLFEKDSVKTGSDSKASILLFEASIVRLNENTEIEISKLVDAGDLKNNSATLAQKAGRTWSKVLKISGVKEYAIESPTAIAAVRGTAFDFWIQAAKVIIGIAEGRVLVKAGGIEELLEEGKQAVVENGAIRIEDFVEDSWVLENKQADEIFKQELKQKLKERFATLIGIAKAQYGLSDEQIDSYIEQAISQNLGIEDLEKAMSSQGASMP